MGGKQDASRFRPYAAGWLRFVAGVGMLAVCLVAAVPAGAAAPGGSVFAFGSNHYGQLGNTTNNGTDNANPTPTLVGLPGQNGPVTQVAVGFEHSLAVTSSGQLYAFGTNNDGQLGNTTNTLSSNPNPTPALVTLPGEVGPVTQAAGGYAHSMAVTSSGQLYGFGSNFHGELGNATNNNTFMPNTTPTLVLLPGQNGPVTQVAVGSYDSLAVTSSGQLYAFGYNHFGQLGTAINAGTDNANPIAALVVLPGQNGAVTQVAAGAFHSLALTSSGQLYAFGDNEFGQLGNATNDTTANPNPVPTLVSLPGQNGQITQIAAGTDHSLVVTSSGQLYAFGYNNDGQLGNNTNTLTLNPNPTPTLVTLPGQTGPVTQAAAGAYYSLAVTSTGQLYSFGDNARGQLGYTTGTAINPTPALVAFSSGATIDTVAGGPNADHTLALVSGLAITPGSLPTGHVGLTYTALLSATGGASPLVWSATGLPSGLSIDATTGAISGKPSAAGSFLVAAKVTDKFDSQASRQFTLVVAPALTAAQIKALLLREITPRGKAAKIAALLKNGGYLLSFKALTAGKAVISWYFLPKGAHLPKVKPRPVLIATGKATFAAAGRLVIKIKLTAKGVKLLTHATKLNLVAKGTFTPTGQRVITATKGFTLKR